MDIFDMARQLGKAIADSEQYKRVKETEKAQEADEAAQQLIGEYNLKRMQLMQRAQAENPTKEEMEAIRNELQQEFDKLMENDAIRAFIEAKNEFDALNNQVNNILSFFINGEQQGGCSGSCATCGGCH